MNTYYIFRHGETFASKENIPYGDQILTAKILPEGIPEVKKIGEYLKDIESAGNYSSEFLRCKETVEIVTQITDKKFIFDSRLNENVNVTFKDFFIRINEFLIETESKYKGNIIICTHGAVIAGIINILSKGKFEEENLGYYPRPGILTIIKDGKLEAIDFN